MTINQNELNKLNNLVEEQGSLQAFLDHIFDSGYLAGVLDTIDMQQQEIDRLNQQVSVLSRQNKGLKLALGSVCFLGATYICYRFYKYEKNKKQKKLTYSTCK